MSKQVFVSYSPIGQSFGSDSGILAKTAKKVFDVLAASKPITGLTRSPLDGVKVTIADGDVGADFGTAAAQGIKDSGGMVGGSYKANMIDQFGVVTELVIVQPV
jgi:hypothetical protein